MYAILINSTKKNYIQYLKFLLESKIEEFDIIEYDNILSLDLNRLSKYKQVLILHRYCYIDFTKLVNDIFVKNPNLCGLSTYWGLGFPYMLILSNESILRLESNLDLSKKYTDDDIENTFLNIFMCLAGVSSLSDLLSLDSDSMRLLCDNHNFISLDNYSYINNINYTKCLFHDSIFMSFDDEDDYFIDSIREYKTGKKYIKYKGRPYYLPIGQKFFVIKNKHIGLLDSNTIVVWDRTINDWKKASQKLSSKIISHIKEKLQIPLDP